MAGVICKCGRVLSTTQVPKDIQLKVYTDWEWDKLMDCEMIIPRKMSLPKYDVWKCPACQRIYVFEDGNSTPIMIYRLED